MPSYTVREIKDQRAWPSDGETKVIYYDVLIEGDEKIVNVGRKPTNLLNVGDVIVGDLQADRGGWKFRAEQKNGFGGGPRQRDPKESRRIAIQHGQKCAVDILRFAHDVGSYEPPPTVGEIVEQVKTVAAALLAQVEEVGA